MTRRAVWCAAAVLLVAVAVTAEQWPEYPTYVKNGDLAEAIKSQIQTELRRTEGASSQVLKKVVKPLQIPLIMKKEAEEQRERLNKAVSALQNEKLEEKEEEEAEEAKKEDDGENVKGVPLESKSTDDANPATSKATPTAAATPGLKPFSAGSGDSPSKEELKAAAAKGAAEALEKLLSEQGGTAGELEKLKKEMATEGKSGEAGAMDENSPIARLLHRLENDSSPNDSVVQLRALLKASAQGGTHTSAGVNAGAGPASGGVSASKEDVATTELHAMLDQYAIRFDKILSDYESMQKEQKSVGEAKEEKISELKREIEDLNGLEHAKNETSTDLEIEKNEVQEDKEKAADGKVKEMTEEERLKAIQAADKKKDMQRVLALKALELHLMDKQRAEFEKENDLKEKRKKVKQEEKKFYRDENMVVSQVDRWKNLAEGLASDRDALEEKLIEGPEGEPGMMVAQEDRRLAKAEEKVNEEKEKLERVETSEKDTEKRELTAEEKAEKEREKLKTEEEKTSEKRMSERLTSIEDSETPEEAASFSSHREVMKRRRRRLALEEGHPDEDQESSIEPTWNEDSDIAKISKLLNERSPDADAEIVAKYLDPKSEKAAAVIALDAQHVMEVKNHTAAEKADGKEVEKEKEEKEIKEEKKEEEKKEEKGHTKESMLSSLDADLDKEMGHGKNKTSGKPEESSPAEGHQHDTKALAKEIAEELVKEQEKRGIKMCKGCGKGGGGGDDDDDDSDDDDDDDGRKPKGHRKGNLRRGRRARRAGGKKKKRKYSADDLDSAVRAGKEVAHLKDEAKSVEAEAEAEEGAQEEKETEEAVGKLEEAAEEGNPVAAEGLEEVAEAVEQEEAAEAAGEAEMM